MAGFLSPSILWLSTWDRAERQFVGSLSKRLLAHGYKRIVEPCACGFAMPLGHVAAGWQPAAIEASDVMFVPCVIGSAVTGRDLAELQVRVDGIDVPLTGEPLDDAAMLLLLHYEQRIALKPDHAYWNELRRDLAYRRADHLEGIRGQLQAMKLRLGGMSFEPRDPWEHVRSVADDPDTVITFNPPTYKGAYEKAEDTAGRVTWAQPEYTVWDPAADQQLLADECRDWRALVVCQQQQEPGEASGHVVHARDLSRGQVVYVWSNRGEEVEQLLGQSAVPRVGLQRRPEAPILPHDYDVTPACRVHVEPIASAEVRYLKDLWLHKIDYKQAGVDFAVYLDGHLAGIAGYDTRPIHSPYEHGRKNTVIMTYATAAPHKDRLTRLVTMLAMNRDTLRKVIDPWLFVQVHDVCTVELTKLPEIKGLRGIMKLESRIPDKRYGNRLVYVAPPAVRTAAQTLDEWCRKEDKWRRQRAQNAA